MVSLVLTLFNEEASIKGLLDDLLRQTVLPHEIILVDGGSTDRTVELARAREGDFGHRNCVLRVVVKPGANIAQGRNIGIDLAEGPYIAVTDAGCRVNPHWLERITELLIANEADFVGGFFQPIASNTFQSILATLTTSPLPSPNFLPSSRSIAFKKSVWQEVGGYPEWLPWGEDTEFNRLCLATGARYRVVADALVYWAVRSTLKAAGKQFFRYAFGDGLANRVTFSYVALQVVYWCSIIGLFTELGSWAVTPVIVLPGWLVLKRRAHLSWSKVPVAYGTSAVIQTARFVGYTWGVANRLKRPRWAGQ